MAGRLALATRRGKSARLEHVRRARMEQIAQTEKGELIEQSIFTNSLCEQAEPSLVPMRREND
jgi:hypothetical protein